MFVVHHVSIRRVVLAVVFLSMTLVVAPADAARTGARCKTAGVVKVTNGVTYKCKKSNGKLQWVKTKVAIVAGSCAAGGVCVVGDKGPGGGIVFYVGSTTINAVSGVSAGGKYLEAAPKTWNGGTSDALATWGCYGTLIGGADGTDVGTGAQNTKDIDAGCTTSGIAADLAINLVFGGQSDWFLPSRGEQVLMYINLTAKGVGGLETDTYWSSSEYDAANAWYQDFYTGLNSGTYRQDTNVKGATIYVRPVRAFG